jgi:hypothetical protein
MMGTDRGLFGCLAIFLGAAPVGCASAQMAVAQDVSDLSEEIAITNRNPEPGPAADESFAMGPYRVAGVHRSGSSPTRIGLSTHSLAPVVRGFAYDFEAEGLYPHRSAAARSAGAVIGAGGRPRTQQPGTGGLPGLGLDDVAHE